MAEIKSFIGVWNAANLITMLGLWSSIVGILLALKGHINYALVMIMVSTLCDMFDGVVARKIKRSEQDALFGKEFDSLIDLVSFGIFPAIIVFSIGLSANIFDYIIILIFVTATAIRLAYFNSFEMVQKGKKQYYIGLPSPYIALVLPIYYVVSHLTLDKAASLNVLRFLMIAVAFLFTFRFHMRKITPIFYILFTLLTVFLSIYLIVYM